MTTTRPLARSFFARPADAVAPDMLGLIVVRTLEDGRVLSGRIVETEAYLGPEDRASHAFNNRRTPRNETMYARPGTCYVYLTYGMHFMLNVACLREGHPAAVLIRALEPLTGLDAMRENRPGFTRDRDLCNGPGKLCQAMSITRSLNGVDLLSDPALRLAWRLAQAQPPARTDQQPLQAFSPAVLQACSPIVCTARVGVDPCGDWAEKPLRWFVKSSPFVSPGRPSVNTPRPLRRVKTEKPGEKPSTKRKRNRNTPSSEL